MAYYIRTRIIIGLILIVLGLIYLLYNYDIEIIPEEFLRWEYLFILFGLLSFTLSKNKIAGVIFTAIGIFNLVPELWPLIFVIIGLYIIFKRKDYEKNYGKFYNHVNSRIKNHLENIEYTFKKNSQTSKEYIEEIAIFGGSTKVLYSDSFRGGNIISIFGGSEINLENCTLADGINILEITAIFGGSTIIVPNNWLIEIDVLPIFGGFSDKRIKSPNTQYDENKKLIIKGLVLFGGGEIKNSLKG